MTLPDLVSTCCAQPLKVEGTTTQYYRCTGCWCACDAEPEPKHMEHVEQSASKTPLAAEPRSWVIRMPAGMELLNANDRDSHWGRRKKITDALRAAAGWLAKGQRIPQLEHAHVVAVYEPPDRRRRDPANLYPSVKAAVDGLVDSGVLSDDDAKHLDGPDMRLGPVHPGGRLVLTITEVPGGEPS